MFLRRVSRRDVNSAYRSFDSDSISDGQSTLVEILLARASVAGYARVVRNGPDAKVISTISSRNIFLGGAVDAGSPRLSHFKMILVWTVAPVTTSVALIVYVPTGSFSAVGRTKVPAGLSTSTLCE